MHMLGHDYERIHPHTVERPGALQGLYEKVAHRRVRQVRVTVITGEGNEVRRVGMMRAIESAGHGESLFLGLPQLPTSGNCGPPGDRNTVRPTFAKIRQMWATGYVRYQPLLLWGFFSDGANGYRFPDCIP